MKITYEERHGGGGPNRPKKQRKPPKKVIVGPHTYVITDDPSKLHKESHQIGDTLYGITDVDVTTIYVDKKLAPSQLADTVLHELIHAMTATTGLDVDLGKILDESVARRLSPALLDMLRRNPKLVAYLTEN
jgi:hypothetical protein